jgi:hypothetical protein
LLGVPCAAVSPYGLYRALLRHGAEIVDVPSAEILQLKPNAPDLAANLEGA